MKNFKHIIIICSISSSVSSNSSCGFVEVAGVVEVALVGQ